MLRSVIYMFILAIHGSLLAQDPYHIVPDIFDLRIETPDSSRAAAFANWFCHAELDETMLSEYGIETTTLLHALKMKDTGADLQTLKQEFIFYPDQVPAFKADLEKYVTEVFPLVTGKLEEKLKKSAVDLVIFRVADPTSFVLGMRKSADVKARLNSLILSPDCRPAGQMIFHKRNGKSRKMSLEEDFLFQEYHRTSGFSSIVIGIGKQEFRIALRALEQCRPYIKKYFASEYDIRESERIALTWEVLGAQSVELDNGIGNKPPKWQINVSPLDTTAYVLTAVNAYGSVSDTLHIDVVQTEMTATKLTFFCPEAGDPKLAVSGIRAKILDMDNREVALFEGGMGLEMNGKTSYYGPFSFNWDEAVYKRQLRRGKLIFELFGPEQDIWTFSPILLLNYSDGTKKELYGFGNKVLETGKTVIEIDF